MLKHREKIHDFITNVIFLMVMVIAPLYLENRYFNVLQAKAKALLAAGAAAVIGGAVLGASALLQKIKQEKNTAGKCVSSDLMDVAVLILILNAVISAALSGNFADSFFGFNGWGVGLGNFLACGVIYFLISRRKTDFNMLWIPVIAVNIVIMWIGILDSSGIDILGLHKNINEALRYDYISTIGQKNSFAAYICLLFPLSYYCLINAESRTDLFLWTALIVPMMAAVVLASSDAIFVGLGIFTFFAIPQALKDGRRLKRTGMVLLILGAAAAVICFLPGYSEKRRFMDGLALKLISPPAFCGLLAAGTALQLVKAEAYDRIKPSVRKMFVIIPECILGLTVLFFTVKSATEFDEAFGSYRGIIWIRSWNEFISVFSFRQKIFGIGPERLYTVYEKWGKLTEWLAVPDESKLLLTVNAAHSEPLQTLMTMGIAQLAAWVFAYAAAAVSYFRNRLRKTESAAYFLPIAAYFGQSLVSTATCVNIGILCIFYALLRREKGKEYPDRGIVKK